MTVVGLTMLVLDIWDKALVVVAYYSYVIFNQITQNETSIAENLEEYERKRDYLRELLRLPGPYEA